MQKTVRPIIKESKNKSKKRNTFDGVKKWPSSDHKVVKFKHLKQKTPFVVKEVASKFGQFENYVVHPADGGFYETKIEMKTSAEAEALWKHHKFSNLIWGVHSVDPDFYYTIKCSKSRKTAYEDYWEEDQVDLAVKNGQVFISSIRINPRHNQHSYISIPGEADVLIPTVEDRNRALEGDIVAVEIKDPTEWEDYEPRPKDVTNGIKSLKLNQSSRTGRKTGRVVRVMKQVNCRVVTGCFKHEDNNKSSNYRIIHSCNNAFQSACISRKIIKELEKKQNIENVIFAYKIKNWDVDQYLPIAELCHSIGERGEIEAETARILCDYNVKSEDFSPEVLECLQDFSGDWKITDEERKKRKDFTSECIFSIDPPTARDLDDALHCKRLPNGNFEVGVHIADVSHFVKPQTALDVEASNRATSVYLVQKVIPMLPRLLCEQLCSLNAEVDRFAFSVVWTLDKNGNILNEWFGKSVIRSCAKFSYDNAQDFIDGKEDAELQHLQISPRFKLSDIRSKILDLHTISQNLRSRRMRDGCLKLDQIRLSYTLDADSGFPNGCFVYQYKQSNELIEEFMLLANISVAKRLYHYFPNQAFLRNHPPPKEDMLDDMMHQCRSLGIEIDISSSKALSESLAAACGSDELSIYRKYSLFMLAIKPQKLATYVSSEDSKLPDLHHYALNVPLYTHFTSPIRRYADLIVHRQLAATLGDRDDFIMMSSDRDHLKKCASNCNLRKSYAKAASDESTNLFFTHFVKNCGSLSTHCMVLNILDYSLDVLSMEYGIQKRIYLESSPLLSFKLDEEDSPSGNQKLPVSLQFILVFT